MHKPPSRPPSSLKLRNLDRRFRTLRRKAFEALGDYRYSRCARGDLDDKLERYLPERGFFVEAGANDGVSESNTYYLERARGWRGVLVEPIPELYRKCVRARPGSTVFQCALVAADFPGATIEMQAGQLLSVVRERLGSPEQEERHAERVREWFGIEPYAPTVPARTLTSVLDEAGADEIDFLSLDVEGYELEALRGLDFERFAPRFLLVECLAEGPEPELRSVLEPRYHLRERLTERDLLFERTA